MDYRYFDAEYRYNPSGEKQRDVTGPSCAVLTGAGLVGLPTFSIGRETVSHMLWWEILGWSLLCLYARLVSRVDLLLLWSRLSKHPDLLISQNLMLLSTEPLAKIYSLFGDHFTASIASLCPVVCGMRRRAGRFCFEKDKEEILTEQTVCGASSYWITKPKFLVTRCSSDQGMVYCRRR